MELKDHDEKNVLFIALDLLIQGLRKWSVVCSMNLASNVLCDRLQCSCYELPDTIDPHVDVHLFMFLMLDKVRPPPGHPSRTTLTAFDICRIRIPLHVRSHARYQRDQDGTSIRDGYILLGSPCTSYMAKLYPPHVSSCQPLPRLTYVIHMRRALADETMVVIGETRADALLA